MSIVELAESLLFEAEGTTLDFKRDQYRFVGASDSEKGELLKDILAFANAFRRAEAYIFIGADEVPGGKSAVFGICDHLEDADLQQFVNGKTNRPVDFSYRGLELEGKKVALIRIPLQKRPIYLIKNYGGLLKDTVYIRRGSSTAIAGPDEIAQMGVATSTASESLPVLSMLFGDGNSRSILDQPTTVERVRIVLPADFEIPDFEREQDSHPLQMIQTTRARPEFLRELVDYYSQHELVVPLGFAVRNDGIVPGMDVDATIEIDDPDGELTVMVDDDLPERPRPTEQIYRMPEITLRRDCSDRDVDARRIGSSWHVNARLGKIRPKETVWTTYKICVGAPTSRAITFRVQLRGDNIPEPVQSDLVVNLMLMNRPETLQTLVERFVAEVRAGPEPDDDEAHSPD